MFHFKLIHSPYALILYLLFSLVLTGCDRPQDCGSIDPARFSEVFITYESLALGGCPGIMEEDIEAQSYLIVDESPTQTIATWDEFNCLLRVPVTEDTYWVIDIPAQGISDTLISTNLVYFNDIEEGCPIFDFVLVGGDFFFNGQVYAEPNIRRDY